MNLTDILDIARANVQGDRLLNGLATGIIPIMRAFESRTIWEGPDWQGWIYHVPIPKEHAKIKYKDVKMDQSVYDYDKIVAHAVARGRAILVNQSLYPFNPLQPMYERVRAMCAYVHSAVFNSPTAFLDGDAFVNADLTPIFETIRDVAVTYRNDPGLMPINEGVILAQPTEGTRAFFRSYLATYETLAKHPQIVDYYGDIRRWRGGQLSLNALTYQGGVVSEMDRLETGGYTVSYLPCSVWNFAMDLDQPYAKEDLDAKATLHLKGNRKLLIDQIIAYQESK